MSRRIFQLYDDYLKEKHHALVMWNDYLQEVIEGESLADNVVLLHQQD